MTFLNFEEKCKNFSSNVMMEDLFSVIFPQSGVRLLTLCSHSNKQADVFQ